MDLNRIISELRAQLEHVKSAIAAVEALDLPRKSAPPAGATRRASPNAASDEVPPVKRPRGRPRKNPIAPGSDPGGPSA
jgi:hypothetical protein